MLQKKGWKIEEYLMYFRFFSLHFWSKRSAAQPQTIYSEFPLYLYLSSMATATSSAIFIIGVKEFWRSSAVVSTPLST